MELTSNSPYLFVFIVVTDDGEQKWKEVLQEVGAGTESEPRMSLVFKRFAGNLDRNEKKILNMMLVDWQLSLKKKKCKEGECPWYQPNAQRTNYFTFWGRMRNVYGWQTKEADFRDFHGAVYAVMCNEFEKREEIWVSFMNQFCCLSLLCI